MSVLAAAVAAVALGLAGTAAAETAPPAPGVAVATDAAGNAGVLGRTGTLTLAPCPGALATPPTACTGTAADHYSYQLNYDPPQDVAATGGVQSLQIPLHHVGPNTVTVYAVSAAGDSGESTSASFDVTTPTTPYADGDIDGDGNPDVLYAGTDADPGLWLARGDGAGGLAAPIDIGAAGNGTNGDGTPADWTGAQVLHGDFTGDHVQDVLAYYPAGNFAGGGVVLYGHGDDSVLSPYSGSAETLYSDTFADYTLNPDGDSPAQLVAAGNAGLTGRGAPDLIGVTGDTANGYQLDLYATSCADCPPLAYGYARTLAGPAESPDGHGDWSDFSLVTAQPGGKTVLFALKKSTGELWESANPAQDPATLVGTPGTWTRIDVPWNSAPTLVSGDVNAAGHVELWARAGTRFTSYTLTDTDLKRERKVRLG